jgi:hypothetical protein
MNNTFAIVSMLKYEHDFLNPWIEHHINIGFTHFYLLIDNITKLQLDYIIDEKFKDKVSLFNCDKNDDLLSNSDKSIIMHNNLNTKIYTQNIIKEDWVIAIGIDQYMYLNGNTIQEYIYNINELCSQIVIPWSLCVFNKNDNTYSNFLENINNYHIGYNTGYGHANGLMRTSNLSEILIDSHFCVSKTETQSIYILNEYFEMPSRPNTWGIFNIIQDKLNNILFEDLQIGTFHIMLRNINEIFIKSYFYWNFDKLEEAMNKLAYSIKNNTYDNLLPLKRIYNINSNKVNIKLKFKNLESINTSTYYDNLIMEHLVNYNITKDEYDIWKYKILK